MIKKYLEEDINDAIFTIFDTETTGDNIRRPDKPIEIAAVHWNYQKGFLDAPKSWLINPQMPIHPAAIAVHGLTDEDVINSPTLDMVLPELHEYVNNTILVAHNIEFDLNMLPTFRELDNPKLDTLRFVRHIFKIGEPGYKEQELSSHKMQELRYWLNIHVDTMGLQAHRAAADILVTGEVFSETMKKFLDISFSHTIEDLMDFISSPIMIEKMNFGKYKNVMISDAIAQEKNNKNNYFFWLLKTEHSGEMTLDPDLKYSIEYHLKEQKIELNGIFIDKPQKNWADITKALKHKTIK
jgi:DNA polymerase III epsilon subunit family exonuclease